MTGLLSTSSAARPGCTSTRKETKGISQLELGGTIVMSNGKTRRRQKVERGVKIGRRKSRGHSASIETYLDLLLRHVLGLSQIVSPVAF